ncbi:MAG: Na+/H+ antiporter NhaA [Deltaproteobacteria bacterium HGW-Deltaproteobacteria-6]|jgi:NhaA family Na+:H+ antiporter|nr:MAG: Na+/H+ antiporter NhaA [Deltaproteobacteria bacterium HGW-Deltaproteobacteria-6]PKN96810.1 MAG: Na+/H+ antiporter NhaA [Chloroflexi bacterium HGW-Chloroflexi-5]
MTEHYYPLEPLFGKIIGPFERFLRQTTAGGIVLMGMTLLTLIVASSPLGDAYRHLWEMPIRIGIGSHNMEMSLHAWVNEGLMALFFLLVGLELKREIMVGELAALRNAALPVAGAMGGMLVPALIYFLFNPSGPASVGWGVPMATDIAFSVGILVLLAWRIHRNLIIFLTALAIADDLGAVLVIALFYTQTIDMKLLGAAFGLLCILFLCNRGGIRHTLPYAILGILLWLAFLKSGVHATLAGVILAFAIPARPVYTPQQFDEHLNKMSNAFHSSAVNLDDPNMPLEINNMYAVAESLEKASSAVQSPQQRMEHHLAPWVTFGVIPLFAMANAGLDLLALPFREVIVQPVTLGVMLGLVLGKFIGISSFAWLAVKLGLARLPRGVQWRHILGAAWLGGIGFTMSLFIAQLAFATSPMFFEAARLGIIMASVMAAIVGLTWLYISARKSKIND